MSKVTELRKSGQLKEAWVEAQAQLSSRPNDIWSIRDFSWVIYDCLKRFTDKSSPFFHDIDTYVKSLAKARSLGIPADEAMFFENAGGNLRAVVWQLAKEGERAAPSLKRLLDEVVLWDRQSPIFLPGTVKGLQKGLKGSAASVVKLMSWYGLDRFSDEDFEKREVDGRKVLSDAETMTHSYLKALQAKNSQGALLFDAGAIDFGIQSALDLLNDPRCEGWQWPQYSLGELLVAAGRAKEAQQLLAPLVVKKPNEPWVWKAFGEAIRPESEDGYVSCVFKGLLVSREAESSLSLHEAALDYFVRNGLVGHAKTEALIIEACRKENGWAASERVSTLLANPSYRDVEEEKSNRHFYCNASKDATRLLSGLVHSTEFYVEWVNAEKRACGVVTMEAKRGYLGRTTVTLNRSRVECLDGFDALIEGETFSAIFDERMRKLIGSVEICPDATIRPHVIREHFGIWDSFSKQDGAMSCFVRTPVSDSNEDVYVPASILDKTRIENGNLVRVKERLSWKKAKPAEGSSGFSGSGGEWIWRTHCVEDLGKDVSSVASLIPRTEFYVDYSNPDNDAVYIAQLKKALQRPSCSRCSRPAVTVSIIRSRVSKAFLAAPPSQHVVYAGWLFGKERCYLVGDLQACHSGGLYNRMIRVGLEGLVDVSNGWGRIGAKENISIPPRMMEEFSIRPGSRVRVNAYSVYIRKGKSGANVKDDGHWEWRVSDLDLISGPETTVATGVFEDSMRGFGFINGDDGESYFVSGDLIRKFGLEDGSRIEANARKSWDRRKQREAWSVIDVVNTGIGSFGPDSPEDADYGER